MNDPPIRDWRLEPNNDEEVKLLSPRWFAK